MINIAIRRQKYTITNYYLNGKTNNQTYYFLQSPVSHQADEMHESERDKLQEMWDASKCKTKLIAL